MGKLAEPTLKPINGPSPPKPPAAALKAAPHAWWEAHRSSWVGVETWDDDALRRVGKPWEKLRIWIVDGDRARELAELPTRAEGKAVHDGRLLVVARSQLPGPTYGELLAVDLETAKVRKLYVQGFHAGQSSISTLRSVAVLPSKQIVCGSMYHLILLAADGTEAHVTKAAASMLGVAGNTILTRSDKQTPMFRVDKGKLKKAGKLPTPLWPDSVWSTDDRWFVYGPDYEQLFELANV